jgi:hypothetical protein
MKYYIKESLPAVLKEAAGSIAFMTIDVGSVITVKNDVSVFGFAEANYAGDKVQVFMRDLELRADRVMETAS